MTPAKAGRGLAGLSGLALDWHRAGRGVAIATVVETWGSAPRPVGSQLIVDETGRMEGSVSGGCVEGAVLVESLEVIEDGAARVLEFGVSDDDAFAVGLACGGQIRILVDSVGGSMAVEDLEKIVRAREARQPIAYVTDLISGTRGLRPATAFPERFRLDRAGTEPDGRQFVQVFNPPLRMFIIGAVHIAQHLAPMARACGYDVAVIDPRPAFASADRFPDTRIIDDWPDTALTQAQLDARSCVVTVTHDPKLDDPAVHAALRSDVFYLGCLGSSRTHAKRLDRLAQAGFSTGDVARIAAPVGLDIGGRSPAEIAVSIIAQVTERLRKG